MVGGQDQRRTLQETLGVEHPQELAEGLVGALDRFAIRPPRQRVVVDVHVVHVEEETVRGQLGEQAREGCVGPRGIPCPRVAHPELESLLACRAHLDPVVVAAIVAGGSEEQGVGDDRRGRVARVAQLFGQCGSVIRDAGGIALRGETTQPAPVVAGPRERVLDVARLQTRRATGEEGRHGHGRLMEGGVDVAEERSPPCQRLRVRRAGLAAVRREGVGAKRIDHHEHDAPGRRAHGLGAAGQDRESERHHAPRCPGLADRSARTRRHPLHLPSREARATSGTRTP